jgi:hypothetical protein
MAALAAFAGVFASVDAFAQSAECARLRAAIASSSRGSGDQAAVARQRSQLNQASAYAASVGCNNQKFLFFGSEPPPQCTEIKGQIARMQATLSELEARSGGSRDDLIARFNSECAAPQPGNIFQALFGGGAKPQQDYEPIDPNSLTPEEQQQNLEKSIENEKKGANVSAGSYAVCVRTCDGSFFPVSYSGASDHLEDVCRALCPNADVQVYSFPFGGTIQQAVSLSGERYVDMPNALKFQQTFDQTCSCRRKGESWAEALAAAEAKFGHEAHDILITPEKSLEMSRPIVAKASADAKAKPGKTPKPDATTAPAAPSNDPSLTGAPQGLNANGEDTALSAAAATVSREASGIASDAGQSGAFYNKSQGKTITETGPDGEKKTVRIVGPSL